MSEVYSREMQTVVFVLDQEEFAIDINRVQEIIMLPKINQMPNSSDFILGIINLRGGIIPIVDLKKKLFLNTDSERSNESRVIVVKTNAYQVGLIVDAVSEVVKVHSDMVVPVNAIHSIIQTEYVSGVAKLENRLLVLLNLDRIFTTQEFSEVC